MRSAALAVLLAGCAASRALDGGPDAPAFDAPALDAPALDAALGMDARADAPRVCVPTCTTDGECASSCPTSPLGATCCDRRPGMDRCYFAMTPECPTPSDVDAAAL